MAIYFPVLSAEASTAAQFVAYWRALYNFTGAEQERKYTDTVGKAGDWDENDLRRLYEWKNNMGSELASTKGTFVSHVIGEIAAVNRLRKKFDEAEFKRIVEGKGVVWSTTLLHAMYPARFPIFDQHVYRAFLYLTKKKVDRLPMGKKKVWKIYYNDYLPFFNEIKLLSGDSKLKPVDEALWAFGQFLQAYPKCIST